MFPSSPGQRESQGGVAAARRRVGGELLGELPEPDDQVTHDGQVRGSVQRQRKIHFQSNFRDIKSKPNLELNIAILFFAHS